MSLDFDTPLWGSEAKPRVLNDSSVTCQTPRCPSPQARPSSPTVYTVIVPSNFAFCLLHFALALCALPHVAQFATYHDGFAVYITASHCDAYISCDAVAPYHERIAFYITHHSCVSFCIGALRRSFALALRAVVLVLPETDKITQNKK